MAGLAAERAHAGGRQNISPRSHCRVTTVLHFDPSTCSAQPDKAGRGTLRPVPQDPCCRPLETDQAQLATLKGIDEDPFRTTALDPGQVEFLRNTPSPRTSTRTT